MGWLAARFGVGLAAPDVVPADCRVTAHARACRLRGRATRAFPPYVIPAGAPVW